MAESHVVRRTDLIPRWDHAAAGFAAGFASVLVFHQGMLTILHSIGLTATMPFIIHPTPPLGVPQIWSLAFWGGVWGIILVWVVGHLPQGRLYWVDCVIFGAVMPSLVAWFIVSPLKGLPLGGGWHAASIATALLVNGAWGLGTAVFLWFGIMRLGQS